MNVVIKQLGQVANIDRQIVDPATIGTATPYVGLEHMLSGGGLLPIETVSAGELASSKFAFTSRHILYGKLRPYLAKVARPEFDGICSTDILPVRPGPAVHRDYLSWLLLSPGAVSWASARAAGANLPRLSPSELLKLPVPLPPLSEQRRIADILDKADALRAKRRAALALLDTLTQSIFLDMFGDPITNPRGWPCSSLVSVGSLDRGVSKHRPRNAPHLLGGPYPFVQTGDVAHSGGYIRTHSNSYSEAGLKQSKMWPAGTLCITIAANIAKTGILAFDACFPDSVVGFRSEEPGMVEYVRVWLGFLQASLEEQAPEVAQKNINIEILRSLQVPVPPARLRLQFEERLQHAVRLDNQLRASLAHLDALFASLQHRAFRGEL